MHDQERADLPLRAERLRNAGKLSAGSSRSMLAAVTDPLAAPFSVNGFGIYDGAPHDASIRFHEPHDEKSFTIRTTLRTGERIKGGRPSGVMNDASSLRSSAAVSLALEAIPAELSREERTASVEAAYADAAAASKGSDWAFTPASLNEIEYVLWYRFYKGGFIAHADMGAFVIAAWGARNRPPELARLALTEVNAPT